MPLALSHEPLFQCSVFQVPDEVPITSLPGLTPLLSSTTSSPRVRGVSIGHSIGRWRIVCWAWLEADGLGGVEVARYSLDCYGNSTLLHFHRRSSLSTRPHGSLGIQTLLGLGRSRSVLCRRHLSGRLAHHPHLVVWARLLRRIWWRCTLMIRVWYIHVGVIVHWRWLRLSLWILTHCHARGVWRLSCLNLSSRMGLNLSNLGLCSLCSLFAKCLGLLLLLRSRGG